MSARSLRRIGAALALALVPLLMVMTLRARARAAALREEEHQAASAAAAKAASVEQASAIQSFAGAKVAEHGAFGEFRTFFLGETHGLRDLVSGAAVIQPGQQIHPPHQHAEEEFLYVAKGEGTWSLDGKESPAHEGDLLYVAPWVMHGIQNTSQQPLTFVVFKWNGKGVAPAGKPGASGK